ncbi:MAG: hypothetical protein U0T56_12650 [Ferruginibacter sp.]
MGILRKYIGDLFIPPRFYFVAGGCAVFFLISFFIPVLYTLARILLAGAAVLFLVDYIFLFVFGRSPSVRRVVQERLSNGDENHILLLRIITGCHFPFTWRYWMSCLSNCRTRHFYPATSSTSK